MEVEKEKAKKRKKIIEESVARRGKTRWDHWRRSGRGFTGKGSRLVCRFRPEDHAWEGRGATIMKPGQNLSSHPDETGVKRKPTKNKRTGMNRGL